VECSYVIPPLRKDASFWKKELLQVGNCEQTKDFLCDKAAMLWHKIRGNLYFMLNRPYTLHYLYDIMVDLPMTSVQTLMRSARLSYTTYGFH